VGDSPEVIGLSSLLIRRPISLRRLSPMPDIMLILSCLSQSVDKDEPWPVLGCVVEGLFGDDGAG
jgi:hypothetical protein